MTVAFTLNGTAISADADPAALLVGLLRETFGLTGARYGCGAEECGACLVLLDGTPRHACGLELASVAGRSVTTPEAVPEPLRAAFLAEQAGQCGYCLGGMLVAAAGLLRRTPRPSCAEVVAALDGNLCRCGAHPRIVAAVLRAAEAMP